MSRRIKRGRAPIDLPVKNPPVATDRLIGHDANGAMFQALVSSLGSSVLDGLNIVDFTPTITSSGTNPSFSWGSRRGSYVRFGPLAYIEVVLPWNSRSGGSGAIQIDFPSTLVVRSNTPFAAILPVRATWITMSTGRVLIAQPQPGTSHMTIAAVIGGASSQNIAPADLRAAGGEIRTSGVFLVQ